MTSTKTCPNLPKNPLEACRRQLRLLHRGLRTEKSYLSWLKRFLRFRSAKGMDPLSPFTEGEIGSFLTHLANDRQVSASTQNQALCAIIFFTKHVLRYEPGDIDRVRAKRKPKLPVVLNKEEIRKIFQEIRIKRELQASPSLIVWNRHAAHGGIAFARERYRLRPQAHCRA